MIKFRDQEIANEQLVLDSRAELYYLGPALTLRNCTLVVKIPAKALVVTQTRLIDCTLEVARVLKNFQWDHAHLLGCRFKGRFVGNDFGSRRGATEGSIVDCDFSEAHLDGTRFLDCDIRTLRFPRWPFFTLFDPVRRSGELRALPWPTEVGRLEVECLAEAPPKTMAVTYSAVDLAKRRGTTPDAIKTVLEKLDGVYY
jgi:hypothetical protein